MKRKCKVNLKNGITALEAANIVERTNKYHSEMSLEKGNRRANAKSMMGIISLNLKCNDEVMINVVGFDEEQMAEAVSNFFEDKE